MIKISYSSELKNSLLQTPIKKNCCRRSEFFGVISAKAKISAGALMLHSETNEFTDYVKKGVRENFNREAQVYKSSIGRGVDIYFRNDNAIKYISEIERGEISPVSICKCQSCHNMFLKGVFIACGRVTDPVKSFHLEFSLGERTQTFFDIFNSLGFIPKVVKRRNEQLIYFKSSEVLEDFFTTIGYSNVTIDIINNTIEGQFKSEANRRANFEMSNITRAVNTGIAQAEIVKRLIDENKFMLLPDELKKTAMLRLENPDVSIAQLATISSPPVSKSGLNHRMQKIIEFSKLVFDEK